MSKTKFVHTNKDGYVRKNWIKTLSKFKGHKVNILEIGVFEGISTKWFLTNLITHKKSILYAVDTFEGSPEYDDSLSFKTVKEKFLSTIKSTKKTNQVKIMQMYSYNALVKIISDNDIIFDIIYIDASHEAKDVISDAILSWNLLKTGGIMIFDDYRWDLLVQEFSKPALAVDSFLEIMKPTLTILHKGYQVIIEKKELDASDLPISIFPKKLSKEINEMYNYFINSQYIFPIKQYTVDINFDIKYDTKYKYDNKIIKLYKRNKDLLQNIHVNNSLNYLPTLLISSSMYDRNKYTKNKFEQFNQYILNTNNRFSYILKVCNYNYWHTSYIYTMSILLQNYKSKTDHVNVCNFKFSYDYTGKFKNTKELNKIQDRLETLITNFYKKINYTLYDISCTSAFMNDKKTDNKHSNIYMKEYFEYKNVKHNRLNLANFDNILEVAMSLKDTIDILSLAQQLFHCNFTNISYSNVIIYYLIVFALITQRNGGNLSIWIPNVCTKVQYDMIDILYKYYKEVKFIIPQTNSFSSSFIMVHCYDFIGIPDTDLNKYISTAKDINKNIPHCGVDKTKFLMNILKTNHNDTVYEAFHSKKYENMINGIKLIKRLTNIEDEISKSKSHTHVKKTKLLDHINTEIFNKQIEYTYKWIEGMVST